MKNAFVLSVLIFFSLTLFGQEPDSVSRVVDTLRNNVIDSLIATQDSLQVRQDSVPQKETRAERRAREKAEKEREKYYFKDILKDSARLEIERVSRVAWRRSLFVPGWGQYTNGGLWWIKVPVIYGGFVTSYLVFDYWQFYYREFQSELQFRYNNFGQGSDGPLGGGNYNETYLQRQRDFSRRNRDITILLTLGWYGLNVVEAYVDSMLSNRWNISDDLTFKVSPAVIPTYAGNMGFMPGAGKSLFAPGVKLTFKIK